METKFEYCKNTGLLYVNEVPFTKEAIAAMNKLMKYAENSSPQIGYSINVTDNHTGKSTVINYDMMVDIDVHIVANMLNLASDEDFI
jgi:hypothetical protein